MVYIENTSLVAILWPVTQKYNKIKVLNTYNEYNFNNWELSN